jgi:hypothetical protein
VRWPWLPLPEDARADRLAGWPAGRDTRGPACLGDHGRAVRRLAFDPRALRLALGSTDVENLRTTLRTVRQATLEEIYRPSRL